jgi:hypothetical protein
MPTDTFIFEFGQEALLGNPSYIFGGVFPTPRIIFDFSVEPTYFIENYDSDANTIYLLLFG